MYRTDPQGQFRLPHIYAGDYQLALQRSGYEVVRQRLTVTESLDKLVIQMRAVEGVRVRVRQADGEAVTSIEVVESGGAAPGIAMGLLLDDAGVGQIPSSLVGRTLLISRSGLEPVFIPAWNGTPLDIELRPKATDR